MTDDVTREQPQLEQLIAEVEAALSDDCIPATMPEDWRLIFRALKLLSVTRDPTPSHAATPSCPIEQNGRSDVTREAVARAIIGASGLRSDKFYTHGFWLQIADAAIAACEKTRWRPIESAPRDAEFVVLSWGGKIVPGRYLDNSDKKFSWQGWQTLPGTPFPAGKPTHFYPLPSPPVTIGEEGE